MKKLKEIFGVITPLSDIFGIFGFFGYNAANIWSGISSAPTWVHILISIFLLLLLRTIIGKFREFLVRYQSYVVKQDLEKATSIKSITSIEKVAPSSNILRIITGQIFKKATIWAEDATLVGFNLYLDYADNWQVPTLQYIFYSDWKKEKAWFYEGARSWVNYDEETSELIVKNYNRCVVPFFTFHPNWAREAYKAFNSVSTRVGQQFHIALQQNISAGDAVPSLSVTYNEGSVKKYKIFDLNHQLKFVKK